MKKQIIYLSTLLAVVLIGVGSFVSVGQNRAEELLRKMSEAMHQMGSYEAAFVVAAGEEQLLGSFAVEGESYHIEIADMEVFGEAAARYEVNKTRREVTLSETESSSANILSNPTHAFELVGSLYTPTLREEKGGKVVLHLKSKQDGTTVRLTLNAMSYLPEVIVYEVEGAQFAIEILSLKPLKRAMPHYDEKAYAGFEVIDFR